MSCVCVPVANVSTPDGDAPMESPVLRVNDDVTTPLLPTPAMVYNAEELNVPKAIESLPNRKFVPTRKH